jgi:hypothetical protein
MKKRVDKEDFEDAYFLASDQVRTSTALALVMYLTPLNAL